MRIPQIQPVNWENTFSFASAAETINGIAAGWKRLEKCDEAKGKQLLVTMRTAENEVLIVGRLKPEGYSSFSASGYVGEKAVMVVGHVSTLQVTCSLVEKDSLANKERIGFKPTITKLPEAKPS